MISRLFKLFFILVCLIHNIALAQPLETHQPYDSNKLCEFKIISTQVAQAPNNSMKIPQQGWENVKLPDNWETRWKNYTGTAWYKIIWQHQCQDQNQAIAFLIERITLAGAVYSNNQLLWQDKSLQEPLSRSWNMPRYWILPSAFLQHEQNEILVRVTGINSQQSGLGQLKFGLAQNIINETEQLIFERRTLIFINIIITFVVGTISFIIWAFRRQEKAYGWFALTSLFWGCFAYNFIALEPFPFSYSLLTARVNLIFLLAYTGCLCLFSWRFAHQHFKKLEFLLFSITFILTVILLITPTTYLQPVFAFSFYFSSIIFILNCIFFQWIAYKNRQKDVLWLTVIFISFLVIILHDLIILINHSNQLPWTPFAAPITSIAFSFILAYRISQDVVRIEKFNQILEETVEKVSFDLEQSLDKKYQLEIENMRLQERLNLSHELHDGLGGSLVRSMILLDHSETIEKNQVLSMFKLLRNDLRQVIDSGSSLGVKVPESPIMWIAPLRHRFVQLFEEMNIESTWIFSSYWVTKPQALNCLTLLRVAEEALTNIVKHSQATDVEVSLIEDQQKKIILEIKDNGQGFIVDLVQEGLHVGLQSMQVRIKRLGGDFQISSVKGLTVIRAILPLKQNNT